MDAALRELVRSRALDRCEYCHLAQRHLPFARLHIEHVRARKHGGDDSVTNLALACDRCNAGKGTNLSGVDPQSGSIVELFHPRRDVWEEHFAFRRAQVVGSTPIGRATVDVLNMNEERRIQLRETLIALGQLWETDPGDSKY